HVLGKTRAAIAGTWMQELVADASVSADRGSDFLDVGADRLAQIGDLVDEADLHGQEGVGGIFGELGRFTAHEHHRCVAQSERLVQALHQNFGAFLIAAHEHAVGMSEIVDRRAFAQKFRIGAHGEISGGAKLLEAPLDLPAGPHRHGRLRCDYGKAVEVWGKLLDSSEYEGEIGMAVTSSHRRAY